MSDLISKSEIISEFENDLLCIKFGSALKGTFRGSIDISDVIERIEEFPSVDAVEVVRCKDCKHNYKEFFGLVCVKGVCVDCIVPEDFYCSYGERKEVSE